MILETNSQMNEVCHIGTKYDPRHLPGNLFYAVVCDL